MGDFLGQGATPVRLPHQLPIYLSNESFLPTSGQVGDFGAPLADCKVLDDVVVAPEFERYLIVAWGATGCSTTATSTSATTPMPQQATRRSAGSVAPATGSCG